MFCVDSVRLFGFVIDWLSDWLIPCRSRSLLVTWWMNSTRKLQTKNLKTFRTGFCKVKYVGTHTPSMDYTHMYPVKDYLTPSSCSISHVWNCQVGWDIRVYLPTFIYISSHILGPFLLNPVIMRGYYWKCTLPPSPQRVCFGGGGGGSSSSFRELPAIPRLGCRVSSISLEYRERIWLWWKYCSIGARVVAASLAKRSAERGREGSVDQFSFCGVSSF